VVILISQLTKNAIIS